MSRRRCPTPRKQAHDTRAKAQAQANSLYAKEGKAALVHAYQCRCGKWHIGGRRKRIGRRP